MKKITLCMALCLTALTMQAQPQTATPMIGAQVFVEPGQTAADIDHWFRMLRDYDMRVCRIRLFEEYIHQGDNWDFTLYDEAFRAADRYGIKVFATLFPTAPNNAIAGFNFPESDDHERHVAAYIERMVGHYKDFKSLYGWVLMNEPGTGGGLPGTDYTNRKLEKWREAHPWTPRLANGYPRTTDFSRENFLVDYTSWYLNWLADEIRKYDTEHELHVNNHQVFDNVAEYDFPAWRTALTSLGASAHPAWHFGYFARQQYTLAMLANCSIIRSGAGPLPFWITELQGGTNTYSAIRGFCPTPEEITQWTLGSVAVGAKGVIYWTLNPRAVGGESGEWALLDFQGKASDRYEAAATVARFINSHAGVFRQMQPFHADADILYIREALWMERKVQIGDKTDPDYEGRFQGAVMKSALGCYEMLLQNGINAALREINEYDWAQSDYRGKTIILANQIAIPSSQWEHLRRFVQLGGKLIVEGLTGYYDEQMDCLFQTGFPLADVFGGSLQESICTPGDFPLAIGADTLTAHLWKGYICNQTGDLLSSEGRHATATRHRYGRGEVLWVPSVVALGARRSGDYRDLSRLLVPEIASLPAHRLGQCERGIIMQTFESGGTAFSLVINKSGQPRTVALSGQPQSVFFADKRATLAGCRLSLSPEETVIVKWN